MSALGDWSTKLIPLIAVTAALILPVHAASDAPGEFRKQFEVPPIRMTYEDLASITERLRSLTDNANGKFVKGKGATVYLSVTEREDTLTVQDWHQLPNQRDLPKTAGSVRFRYTSYGSPISAIEITLGDVVREVVVSGTDASQVQAVSSFLREALSKHSTFFGGSSFRLFGGVLLYVIGWLVGFLRVPGLTYSAQISLGTSLLIVAVPWILPWATWFPGTAVFSGSANWIDRNANMFGFISFVLTILIPLSQVIYWRTRQRTPRR